ncbi:MAG: hypothetical protein COA79_14825 [Planctomycetota bacterium]|nr:MAG: hypothetical protein COA79_14825 [Planctomycetota bacterium]
MIKLNKYYKAFTASLITLFLFSNISAQDGYEYHPFNIEFEMEDTKTFKKRKIKYSDFPGGVSSAFIYEGPKKPETHKFFHDMGFKSTVWIGPNTDAKTIKAIEDTGAHIGVSTFPGGKGTYKSNIGANTIQEAFDIVAYARLKIKGMSKGNVFVSAQNGHFNLSSWVHNRDNSNDYGYGAVFSDANFRTLVKSTSSEILTLLGFSGRHKGSISGYQHLSSMKVKNIPNELIYYKILVNAFKGAISRKGAGIVVKIQLRDFNKNDLNVVKRELSPYGNHPLIWHVNQGMILSNNYLKGIIKIFDVSFTGKKGVLKMGIRKDVYGPIINTPLSIKFPKGIKIKSLTLFGEKGTVKEREGFIPSRKYQHVTVPIHNSFKGGLEDTWTFDKKEMLVPSKNSFSIKIKNNSKKEIKNIKLHWYTTKGLPIGKNKLSRAIYGNGTIITGTPDKTTISPNGTLNIKGSIETRKFSRLGLIPISLNIEATIDGIKRYLLLGHEIAIKPYLGINMIPKQQFPLKVNEHQYMQVTVSNKNKFLHSSTGVCKGIVKLLLPDGMKAAPEQFTFNLKKSDTVKVIFKVTNLKWDDNPGKIIPIILLNGQTTPISHVAFQGTTVIRNQILIDLKPLDDMGMLVYASYDDLTKGGHFDKSIGSSAPYIYPEMAMAYFSEGKKHRCMGSVPTSGIYDTYGNIDAKKGTVSFWAKRDPQVKNESRYKGNKKTSWKNIGTGDRPTLFYTPGLRIYRCPDWSDAPGYIEVIYIDKFGKGKHDNKHVIQVPFNKIQQKKWYHIAVAWDTDKRILQLYIDGKLVGTAEKGNRPWYPFAWDQGGFNLGHPLRVTTVDHGACSLSLRDEFYSFNKILTADEINKNLQLAK